MAKHRIDIRGRIIRNDYKWYYDWFEMDSTCPNDIRKVVDAAAAGDDIDVYISSPGGDIGPASDIYTMLREAGTKMNIMIHITGEAHSAGSIIACAARSEMSPTALMMVHCVSSWAGGNHTVMEHEAEVLRTADRALCTAYMEKTGMTEEEALDMMEHETWLTAFQALERGLVDEVMSFEKPEEAAPMAAAVGGFRYPTQEQMDKVRSLMGKAPDPEIAPAQFEPAGDCSGTAENITRRNREAAILQLSMSKI